MEKQKPLIIVAVTAVVLVIAYFIYDRMRPGCDGIFEQTSTKLGGSVELIKTRGELFVGREKIQELAESSQKVGLYLKACCVAQRDGALNTEQLQGCMNGAKDYESKILQVSSILSDAEAAKNQGNRQAVEQKTAQAREAVSAASKSENELGSVVSTIPSNPNSQGERGKPSGPPATEKHTLDVGNYAGTPVTVSINGTWVGQWDTNSGTIPLDAVVQGKNELAVELQGEPKAQLTIEVWAKRPAGDINLLRMNPVKAGSYTYTFVAR